MLVNSKRYPIAEEIGNMIFDVDVRSSTCVCALVFSSAKKYNVLVLDAVEAQINIWSFASHETWTAQNRVVLTSDSEPVVDFELVVDFP